MVTTTYRPNEERRPLVIEFEDERDSLNEILLKRGMKAPSQQTPPPGEGIEASPQVSERR